MVLSAIDKRSCIPILSAPLNGVVAGVWDYADHPSPALKTFLFGSVEPDTRNLIKAKALQVGQFIAGQETQVIECCRMTPLPERTAGGFMTPLKGC